MGSWGGERGGMERMVNEDLRGGGGGGSCHGMWGERVWYV